MEKQKPLSEKEHKKILIKIKKLSKKGKSVEAIDLIKKGSLSLFRYGLK